MPLKNVDDIDDVYLQSQVRSYKDRLQGQMPIKNIGLWAEWGPDTMRLASSFEVPLKITGIVPPNMFLNVTMTANGYFLVTLVANKSEMFTFSVVISRKYQEWEFHQFVAEDIDTYPWISGVLSSVWHTLSRNNKYSAAGVDIEWGYNSEVYHAPTRALQYDKWRSFSDA